MPRIRTIKPDIWQDEEVGRGKPHVRLAWIGLITQADDEGRLLYRPRILRTSIFPYDDDLFDQDMVTMLDVLQEAKLLLVYKVNGKELVQIVNWEKHQRVNRPTPSQWDPPDPELLSTFLSDDGAFTEGSLNTHGDITESSCTDGKGMDRKGKDTSSRDDGYSSSFVEMWKTWPKKVGKKTAARCHKKLLKDGIAPDDLLAAAAHYIPTVDDPKYCKNLSTFLGPDRHWEEYVSGIPGVEKQERNCRTCSNWPESGKCEIRQEQTQADEVCGLWGVE